MCHDQSKISHYINFAWNCLEYLSIGLEKILVPKKLEQKRFWFKKKSYGQQRSPDCKSTLDRVTNWLYLLLVPLASFNLLHYYIRLEVGGGAQCAST